MLIATPNVEELTKLTTCSLEREAFSGKDDQKEYYSFSKRGHVQIKHEVSSVVQLLFAWLFFSFLSSLKTSSPLL